MVLGFHFFTPSLVKIVHGCFVLTCPSSSWKLLLTYNTSSFAWLLIYLYIPCVIGWSICLFFPASSVYNNIHHPSKLALRADLYCFKHKIEPKWEDPVCASGGKWTVNFSRGKSDNGWLYTVLPRIPCSIWHISCFLIIIFLKILVGIHKQRYSRLYFIIIVFSNNQLFPTAACYDRRTVWLWWWNLWSSC